MNQSISQLEVDVARRQERWRDVRARHEREARRHLDDQDDPSPGASRAHIDFDELLDPYQVVTHPFDIPEEAAHG